MSSQEISASIEELTATINQVSQAVQNMAGVAQESAENTDTINLKNHCLPDR